MADRVKIEGELIFEIGTRLLEYEEDRAPVRLSISESVFLSILSKNLGGISERKIIEATLYSNADPGRRLDKLVNRLRKRIKNSLSAPGEAFTGIVTVYDAGYMLHGEVMKVSATT